MQHINDKWKPAATVLVVLLGILALAACGGSSTTSTGASASTASKSTTPGSGGGRFAAVRECLQKNGITLPPRTPRGGRGPGSGSLLGAGAAPQLPAGVSRAQYEAALKKCAPAPFPSAGAPFKIPA